WDDPTVLFVSLHQWPFYPGSGGPAEQAETTVNVPLRAGSGDPEYLDAFDEIVAPAVERFEPELVLVSAGFDAHERDPLAQMRVTADGFRELARRSRALAPQVGAVLEGGYNLETLPDLVAARASIASLREETPSFASTLFTCERTVCSEMNRRFAISSVSSRSSRRSSTSTSRALSAAAIESGTPPPASRPPPSRTCSSRR